VASSTFFPPSNSSQSSPIRRAPVGNPSNGNSSGGANVTVNNKGTDSYQGSVNTPLLKAKDMRALVGAPAQDPKTAIIDSMMKKGVGAPTASERKNLQSELSAIDTDVLNLVAQNGTKMGVASPGDDLVKLGAVTPLTTDQVKSNTDDFVTGSQNLHKVNENLEGAINARSAFQEAGGDPNSAKGKEVQSAVDGVIDTMSDAYASQPEDAGVAPFMSPYNRARQSGNHMAMQMASMAPTTVPLESLSASAGAQTPEETKFYTDMVEKMNAPQLPGIGERGRASLTEQVKNADNAGSAGGLGGLGGFGDMQGQQAKNLLAQSEGKTLVNWDSEMLHVPDIHFHRDLDPSSFGKPFDPDAKPKPSLLVDGHDKRVLDGWGGGTRTMVDVRTEAMAKGGAYTEAQHFRKSNLVLYREGGESAGVHELGHVVEDIIKKKDPEWYQEFNGRVTEAYESGQKTGSVTRYALADQGEYVAEGFSHYYEDPDKLKQTDPTLYNLSHEMIQKARAMGRQ
jgi:hypothetical protein